MKLDKHQVFSDVLAGRAIVIPISTIQKRYGHNDEVKIVCEMYFQLNDWGLSTLYQHIETGIFYIEFSHPVIHKYSIEDEYYIDSYKHVVLDQHYKKFFNSHQALYPDKFVYYGLNGVVKNWHEL